MGHASLIALAAALEMEFRHLHGELVALSHSDGLEDKVNAFLSSLPEKLTALTKETHSTSTLESILATKYAEGVASAGLAPVRLQGKLMRMEQAMSALRRSGVLSEAVNTLIEAEKDIQVRSAVVVKLLKGKIVQDLREQVLLTDRLNEEQAQAVLADAAKPLTDLSTNKHVKAHVETQEQLAQGYGLFSAQQTKEYLARVPFQEFYRAEHRVEWRDWPSRWTEQGGRFYPGPSDYPAGRMIAEVQSGIWEDLSDPAKYDDATGSPYPPFAYNSGMSVKPVTMAEAAKLGLLGKHRIPPKPKKLQFNAGITFSVDLHPDIQSALLDSMQDWAEKQEVVPA